MLVTPTPISVVNCCPHDVTIYSGSLYDPFSGKSKGGNPILKLAASGIVATAVCAVDAKDDLIVNDCSVPTCTRKFVRITKLPSEEGKLFIVPSLYAQAAKELELEIYSKLLVPYGTVVDAAGKTVGCTGLVRCA